MIFFTIWVIGIVLTFILAGFLDGEDEETPNPGWMAAALFWPAVVVIYGPYMLGKIIAENMDRNGK